MKKKGDSSAYVLHCFPRILIFLLFLAQPWLFKPLPEHCWHSMENQRKFTDWLGKRLGVKTFEDWYKVVWVTHFCSCLLLSMLMCSFFFDSLPMHKLVVHIKRSTCLTFTTIPIIYYWKQFTLSTTGSVTSHTYTHLDKQTNNETTFIHQYVKAKTNNNVKFVNNQATLVVPFCTEANVALQAKSTQVLGVGGCTSRLHRLHWLVQLAHSRFGQESRFLSCSHLHSHTNQNVHNPFPGVPVVTMGIQARARSQAILWKRDKLNGVCSLVREAIWHWAVRGLDECVLWANGDTARQHNYGSLPWFVWFVEHRVSKWPKGFRQLAPRQQQQHQHQQQLLQHATHSSWMKFQMAFCCNF